MKSILKNFLDLKATKYYVEYSAYVFKAQHWLGLKQEVAENLNQYLMLANSPKIL